MEKTSVNGAIFCLNPERIVRELSAQSGQTFLWAAGRKDMCGLIREAYGGFAPLSLHDTAMDLYKTYLAVGGMPRAVWEYADKRDFDFVSAALKTLNDSYIADMAKYAAPQETARVMAAWASVPAIFTSPPTRYGYRRETLASRTGSRASRSTPCSV
jgi:hypothetical protein